MHKYIHHQFSLLLQEYGQVTNYYVYLCDSKSVLIWLGIIFGYKAILQIIGLLLAFGTRKVKVEGLNDAKFIGGIIYITSITLTVIIVSFVTLADYLHALAAVYSIGYLVSATVILGLIFLPKVTLQLTPCTLSPVLIIIFR